jgi:hypothetical protein
MTRDEIIKELKAIGDDSEKWSREDAIWLVELRTDAKTTSQFRPASHLGLMV